MKTLFFVTFLLLTLNLSSSELDWVDEQVNAIKPPRNGIKSSAITRLRNPFVFLHKKEPKKAPSGIKKLAVVPNGIMTSSSSSVSKKPISSKKKALSLSATMNHSALINGKWYKINDKVGFYTLCSVKRTSVVLKNKTKTLVLSTNSKNLNLKFNNK